MAFAPHTNTDVHDTKDYNKFPLILGSFFVEKDKRTIFEYAVRPDDGINFAPDCPHIVYVTNVIDGRGIGFRYAKVLKTVAWIVVDEDDGGEPIYEKWEIKQHRHYDTSWV
jgi:hypothetical protein